MRTSFGGPASQDPVSASDANKGSQDKSTAAMPSVAMPNALDEESLQVHDVIAQGGYGTVHRGTWRGLPVAVKSVVFQVTESADSALERAVAEASIAYSLMHPNIVVTYVHELTEIEHSVSTSTRKLVLVQELCNGGTLRKLALSGLLRTWQGTMQIRRILRILAGICSGMEYIHSRRVMHADLNPNNILLHVPGADTGAGFTVNALRVVQALEEGRCHPKVTDFGLSVRLDTEATHTSNYNRGTPFYAAPELYAEKRLAPSSDTFSFGVIMWELASGYPPFRIQDGLAQLHPLFRSFASSVPGRYARLTAACLDPAARNRPSFCDVACALDGLVKELEGGSYVDCRGNVQSADLLGFPSASSRKPQAAGPLQSRPVEPLHQPAPPPCDMPTDPLSQDTSSYTTHENPISSDAFALEQAAPSANTANSSLDNYIMGYQAQALMMHLDTRREELLAEGASLTRENLAFSESPHHL